MVYGRFGDGSLQDYLRAQEVVEAMLPASTPDINISRLPADVRSTIQSRGTRRLVVVTSQRILVFAVKGRNPPSLTELLAQVSPTTRLDAQISMGRHRYYRMHIGSESLEVELRYGQALLQANYNRPGESEVQAEDHELHAQGRVCKTCGRPILPGESARRRGESQWAHEVCPIF
jgi:hypothetical protein